MPSHPANSTTSAFSGRPGVGCGAAANDVLRAISEVYSHFCQRIFHPLDLLLDKRKHYLRCELDDHFSVLSRTTRDWCIAMGHIRNHETGLLEDVWLGSHLSVQPQLQFLLQFGCSLEV